MFDFPISPPTSAFEWQAFKEIHCQEIDQLNLESLATLYGLCHVEPFRDDAFIATVDDLLSQQKEPTRWSYEFACELALSFWDRYARWKIQDRNFELVGDLPDELKKRIMAWLVDGIQAYKQDLPMMRLVYWLKYRSTVMDTYLDDVDIETLETTLGAPIDFSKDEHARILIDQVMEKFKERGKQRWNG